MSQRVELGVLIMALGISITTIGIAFELSNYVGYIGRGIGIIGAIYFFLSICFKEEAD